MMEPVPNSVTANQYNNYGFPKNMKNKNVYTQKNPCVATLAINGRTYYVKVACKDVCPRMNRVLVDNFDNAPDGIYTYMLYKKGGQLGFAYVKVLSTMEYGSLHKTLFYETGPEEVIIAGECKKEGTNISYNFQSGTYAAKIFEKHKYNSPKQQAYAGSTITPLLQSLYPTLTFTYSTEPSFINKIRVSIEEIRELEEKGFEVILFENRASCLKCSSSMEPHRAQIAQYQGQIQKEQEGMKKNPKLYHGYSIPFWQSEIERIQAIINECEDPALQKHLRDVRTGGKRKTRKQKKSKRVKTRTKTYRKH